MEKRIDSATDIPELLGLEGNASAAYFRSFRFMLKEELGFDFDKEVVDHRQTRRMHC